MKYYEIHASCGKRDPGVVFEIGSKFGSQSKTVAYGVGILLFEWKV